MNIFLTTLLFGILSSCNVIKDNDNDLENQKLISTKSVQLLRTDANRKINLSLTATRPVNCEILYWEDSDTTNAETAEIKDQKCQEDGVYKKIISTTIDSLSPNKSYRFRIRSWSEDAQDNIEETSLSESTNNSSAIGNSKSYVIKNQLNKNIGGLFSNNTTSSINFAALETGCEASLPEPSLNVGPLLLNSVKITGFTNSNGRQVQLAKPFVEFSMLSKNYDQPFRFDISDNDGSKSMRFNAPLAFKSLEASSLEKVSVPSFREGDNPPTINSSNGNALDLSWTTKGRTPTAYLNVYVDDISGNRLLECRYNANDRSARIQHQTIRNLSPSNYRISVEIKSFETEQSSNSLIISSDWRVITLKRS